MSEKSFIKKTIPYLVVIVTTAILVVVTYAGSISLLQGVSGEPTKLTEVTQIYGNQIGFSKLSQKQSSGLGVVSTTVVATVNTDVSNDPLDPVERLIKTLKQVADGQTVGLDLTIKSKLSTYHFVFNASSMEDYENQQFKSIKSIIGELLGDNNKFAEYFLEYTPTVNSTNITIEAYTLNNEGTDLKSFNNNLIESTYERFPVKPGGIYDITYGNKVGEQINEGERNSLPISVRSIFNSTVSYDKALNHSNDFYAKLSNFAKSGTVSNLYKNMVVKETQFITAPLGINNQLIIIVPESDAEKIAVIRSELTTGLKAGRITATEMFDINVRNSLDGTNLLTFPGSSNG